MNLKELRRKMDAKLASRAAAAQQHSDAVEALEQAQSHDHAVREATAVAQKVAAIIQEEAHHKIADVVSRSLEAVFDDPYTFRILFEQKRGRTEASLVFTRDGMDVDPITSSGGGVVAIAALALRISCLMLSRPPLRRLLVLDETLVHLSPDRVPNAAALILELSKQFDIQIIMVSHVRGLQIGKVIQL